MFYMFNPIWAAFCRCVVLFPKWQRANPYFASDLLFRAENEMSIEFKDSLAYIFIYLPILVGELTIAIG